MLYTAQKGGLVKYLGNKVNEPRMIAYKEKDESLLNERFNRVKNEKIFYHINNIDNAIFNAVVIYFNKLGAKRANLPIITLMISSPGEVYAGKTLDYTTDALPIEILNRFGTGKRVFLAESSQLYLELYLLINGLDSIFSIYNSFRKEKGDATHLSEFQHIEYEGKVNYEENITILMGLFDSIMEYLFANNLEDLKVFLTDEQIKEKQEIVRKGVVRINLYDALKLLYEDTKEDKYKEFTLKYFGTREEIRLTEILKSNVIVEKFPMLEIPFYHAIAEEEIDGKPLSKNADLILYGYREVIGSGERIKSKEVLLKKAEIFNLPKDDYIPYLQSRDCENYQTTSGFGLGWQRLTQRILNQPYIYEATVFPRTDLIPNP